MTGVDKTLLRHLLWIDGSWEIEDYQIDLRRRRCDVWIGPQVERGWFGRPKAKSAAGQQQHVWQHVALGEIRFHLHVTVPEGRSIQGLHWTGTVGEPFTASLAQQVFTLFNEGLTLQAICSTLKLSLNDVWRYRYALDHGRARVQKAAALAAAAAAAPTARRTGDVAAASLTTSERPDNVPDVADPVWLRLASGELQIDIRVLSLKLMLTKVRSHLEMISDDEVKLLKLRDLHRYFVKNERVLAHELQQLRTA
ncbi:MAG TPA: hypothetical protein VFR90_05060 [Methylibium sp.]|uniref:hypothetical protein n=1 Tax=Methylibium sp. TaxID=2067992 RepID=UPI002DBE0136|nr:hypothetical protein [Methylibium sp.]HEU4458471.1 hypothetical protein [Methylibium sp.]